jgi:hypothetical protein
VENNDKLKEILYDLNEFYNNSLSITKSEKKASKKLYGHNLFHKSLSVGVYMAAVVTQIAAGLFGFYKLLDMGLVHFNLIAGSVLIAAGVTGSYLAISNGIRCLNMRARGKLGRTYARMYSNNFFQLFNDKLKKEFKSLLKPNEITDKTKLDYLELSTILHNIAYNHQDWYEDLCDRVENYSPKLQAKWKPILDRIDTNGRYLLANARKFDEARDDFLVVRTEKNFIINVYDMEDELRLPEKNELYDDFDEDCDSEYSEIFGEKCDIQRSSNFEQFKKYLETKKEIQRIKEIDKEYFTKKYGKEDEKEDEKDYTLNM